MHFYMIGRRSSTRRTLEVGRYTKYADVSLACGVSAERVGKGQVIVVSTQDKVRPVINVMKSALVYSLLRNNFRNSDGFGASNRT